MSSASNNGLKLNYEVRGDGDPVLLLTGVGTDHSAWDVAQTPALSDAGFMSIGVDYRDVGQSDPSPIDAYTIKDVAHDVRAIAQSNSYAKLADDSF